MNIYQFPDYPEIDLLRWSVRLLCALLLYLIIALAIDEWSLIIAHLTITESLLLGSYILMCMGFLISWNNECAGGIMFLLGFISFIILNYFSDHSVTLGYTYVLFPIVSVLLFICWRKSKLPYNER